MQTTAPTIKPAAHALLFALALWALSFVLALVWKAASVAAHWADRGNARLVAAGGRQLDRFTAWKNLD